MVNATLNSTVKNCVAQFKRGNTSTRDAPRAISPERVGSIIHEHLDMRKFSAKWVLECLNTDQKRQRFLSSEQILGISLCNPKDFPSRLVTMNENWLYHYDPRQSKNQCSGGIAAHPEHNIPSTKFLWNISRHEFFLDQYIILYILYQRGVLLTSAEEFEGYF